MKVIVLTIYLYLFCLVAYAQSMLTIGEVYNYDVGDEFHYNATFQGQAQSGWYYNWYLGGEFHRIRMKIENKYYSPNGETVFYGRSFNNYRIVWIGSPTQTYDYIFSVYSDTVSYTDLDSNINHILSNFVVDSCNFYSDTSFVSQQYCNRDVYYYDLYSSSCFEGLSLKRTLGEGLGETNLHYMLPEEYTIITKDLKYYKKNNQLCGNPDLVGIEDVIMPQPFVYPNPTDDMLYVFNPFPQEVKASLVDFMGKRVKQHIVISAQGTLIMPLRDQPSGIYFLQVSLPSGKVVTEKVIKN